MNRCVAMTDNLVGHFIFP